MVSTHDEGGLSRASQDQESFVGKLELALLWFGSLAQLRSSSLIL